MKLFVRVLLLTALLVAAFSDFHVAFAPTAYAHSIETLPSVPIASTTEVVVETEKPQYDALACNCYALVKSRLPSFPQTKELESNTSVHIGVVAIFDYSGLPHYGIVTRFDAYGFWISDSNFKHCQYLTHYIKMTDPAIRGFWEP